MRGIFGGVLTLIILQAIGSSKGPEQAGKFLGWVQSGLDHALSPSKAAIPTRKSAAKPSTKPATPSKPNSSTTGGVSLPRNPVLGTVNV
jgi:hypothetical protein